MSTYAEQRPVVLIGGGGHAKVILDIAGLTGRTVAGILSANSDNVLPIADLGSDDRLREPAFVAAHDFLIAVGNPQTRRRIATTLAEHGARLTTMIHPATTVATDVVIGGGTALAAGAIVNPGTVIGQHCILNTAASVDHDCEIADGVLIGPGARLCGGVECREGVLIGAGAVVTEGHVVGTGAVVGAGATVVSDIPPGVTVVGTPAQAI